MADDSVSNIYGGLNFVPADTMWGTGAQIIGQALPSLVNPYASPMQNLGVTLGGALVASLLGYQGRKEAFDMSLQTQQYANQMQALQSAQERTAFLGALPSDVQSSRVGSRLSALSQALMQQEARVQSVIDAKLAEQEALAKFELGDVGEKLQKNKLKQAVMLAGVQGGMIPTEFSDLFQVTPPTDIPQVPGLSAEENKKLYIKKLETKAAQEGTEGAKLQRDAVAAVKDLEKTFRDLNLTAAEFKLQKMNPGSPADLAYSKLKGSLAALARVSGQTSQLSDTDLKQQLAAVMGPEVPFLGAISGTTSIADRIKAKLDAKAPIASTTINNQQAGKAFYNGLIAKYGADWKSKITDSEKTTLKTLLDAAKGQ